MKKLITALAMLSSVVFSGLNHASLIVEPGFDLLHSIQPTNFLGIAFEGVPLGDFDFGGSVGVKGTGNADTIVQRLEKAEVSIAPNTATIDIELVALQLVSVDPVDLGGGLDLHYITLQSGTPSPGEMAITFADENGGTFDSFFDVFFDIRIGAIDGVILASDNLRLSSENGEWDRTPPPGAIEIAGVNLNLAGPGDPQSDFWPSGPGGGPIMETHPDGAMHTVVTAVPTPTTLALFGLGLAGLGWSRRKKV